MCINHLSATRAPKKITRVDLILVALISAIAGAAFHDCASSRAQAYPYFREADGGMTEAYWDGGRP